MASVLDLSRTGGIDWLEATRGALEPAERRRLRNAALRELVTGLPDRLRLATGRRPDHDPVLPPPPDSALARDAEARCAEQSVVVQAHSYRTWAFGRALAAADEAPGFDDELFYLGCLLHDHGLDHAVAGEDFTLRSAAVAEACIEPHRPDDRRLVADMISAHCTPGATVEVDGVHATYIQAGATADLLGSRLADLSRGYVDSVHTDHPRGDLVAGLGARIRAEAAAVPDGRFAMLHRIGFVVAMRTGPSRRVR
ncbi:MAG: phosphohydrolase [Actinomycetota bacterium]